MVGLNHEMGRELLWREYPTDQRGTCFRQFWDRSGSIDIPADSVKDIPPITDWPPAAALGASIESASAKDRVVLLMRGELLRRYPGAIIYLVEGEWAKDSSNQPTKPGSPRLQATPAQRLYPAFHGTLKPDITFLGFNLDATTVLGNAEPADGPPGWYFVIEQPPTEARYGLDETASNQVGSWRYLAWPHVTTTNDVQTAAGPVQKGYIRLRAGVTNFAPLPTTPTGVSWDLASNSAALAYIALQPPSRIAVHARRVLPGLLGT
jgi:hypothetical protein